MLTVPSCLLQMSVYNQEPDVPGVECILMFVRIALGLGDYILCARQLFWYFVNFVTNCIEYTCTLSCFAYHSCKDFLHSYLITSLIDQILNVNGCHMQFVHISI